MVAVRVVLHSKSIIVEDIPGFVREQAKPGLINPFYADADLTAEQMGRLCYLSGHRPNPRTAHNAGYLLNICYQRHYSVLAHSFASIYVDDVSRNCTHEILRSRWFSFSEVSQRYVDVSDFHFPLHPGLANISDFARTVLNETVDGTKAAYTVLVHELIQSGMSRKEARQAARSIIPGGIETKIGMSGNLRAWRDFLAQRLAPGADLEIQGVALEILKIMKREFPNSFQDFDIRGLITTERLIKRAQKRREAAFVRRVSGDVVFAKFSEEVDKVIEQGLWVLEEDPWIDDEYGSDI